ncbi:type II secretion system protein [Candidatus Microgenomates bacterium]|nr:MAG: type II secretion system protein [Candidatus Microgenomates bacterium]
MKLIKNLKLKIKNSSEGFTLIELLAVVVVFMSIGIIVTSILFSSLRGSSKTNAITTVRQNGNYALIQMEKMLRNARKFEGVSETDTVGSYITNCTQVIPDPPAPTPTPVAYRFIKITSFDNRQTTFACCPASSDPAMISSSSASPACSNKVNLLDQNAVSLSDCKFTCTQASVSEFPIISIDFSLNTAGSNLLYEKKASDSDIPFQTSVMMRNLKR